MKKVHYISTLFYYDGPQVFDARDDIGGRYVGVAVTRPDGRDGYLVKGVKPGSLNAFRAGETDLKAMLLEVDADEWYLTDAEFDVDAPIKLEPQNASLVDSGYLPDAGFLLREHPAESYAFKESRKRNNSAMDAIADAE
ncbi:MAG: hypothetical protein OXU98_01040 [Gammaproteobacteria bacterium]|nr:hypothetical protein [Gammaproteobacteria bacterium]